MELSNKAEETLKHFTRHKSIRLMNSGNAAILASLYITSKLSKRKVILIPDQGGWISFRTYPGIFGFNVKEVKTDKGVIDLKDLAKKSKNAAAFLVTSFAGYYAEQPIGEISEICRKNKCLLIEDASGAIGISDEKLCNGDHSNIIVGSFGRWKPVNLGYGGFISVSKKEYFEKTEEIYSAIKFRGDYDKLLERLENAGKRIVLFIETSKKIKKELQNMELNVFHPEKRGLNAVIGFKSNTEKEKIMGYCKENGYEFVVCPKDIRVDEDAVSIEVKRMG